VLLYHCNEGPADYENEESVSVYQAKRRWGTYRISSGRDIVKAWSAAAETPLLSHAVLNDADFFPVIENPFSGP
jgi:hypothetical protein